MIEVDTRRHIVLEWCEGPALQAVLDARGALALDEAREVLRQCLQALRYLHGRGIVHRDIKPANVMFVESLLHEPNPSAAARRRALREVSVRDRQIKLIDFGLARELPSAKGGGQT